MTTRNQLEQLRRDLERKRGGQNGIIGMSERMRKKKATHCITPASRNRAYYDAVIARTEAGSIARVMARRGLHRLNHEFVTDPNSGETAGWMPRQQKTGD